jgi:shikimate dehydrogenase
MRHVEGASAVVDGRGFLSLITGSFSTPAGDNPTVAMIEAAYRHHGINARYLNCEVAEDALADAVRGARAMGWVGFNCSIPHKIAVIDHLDGLGDSAQIIGAVNCVLRRDRELIGENTDGQGFVASLRSVIDPAGAAFVLFGAGGAARAIAVEVALAGATSITVVNRDAHRGAELVELIESRTPASADLVLWDRAYQLPPEIAVVVNATSIRAGEQFCPSGTGRGHSSCGIVVADVIPNPPRTALIRDAKQRGCRVLDGLGMLVEQGVISIRHWTGREC